MPPIEYSINKEICILDTQGAGNFGQVILRESLSCSNIPIGKKRESSSSLVHV